MVHEYGNDDDFVGHVGGDDFIIVTTPDRVKTLCRFIIAGYKQESIALYRPEDVQCGLINGVDRKGRPYQFPLVSLSIGIVSNQLPYAYSIEDIGPLAAEAKRHAKQSIDNVFHISYQRSQVSTEQLCSPHMPSPRSSSAFFAFGHHHYPPPRVEENMLAEFK